MPRRDNGRAAYSYLRILAGLLIRYFFTSTQKELAVLAGVSGPTVNSFEQGKTSITLESTFKILRCLGLH